ncbi:MAG: carbonic anhydrase [Kofleriaceae bacterium]|nr:carbonic anhydrase [Kofleriaceae bacterium]MBP6841763.1 carbonic anhydrase [Kofleriaceae bacterium]
MARRPRSQLPRTSPPTGPEALAMLRAGNRRYVGGLRRVDAMLSHGRRDDLETQAPVAIVLGCSDSRAPAEVVFDVGLGELFVIRVAGNIVAPSQVASVEFAAARFGTRLVVVMGHSGCGAIKATLEALRDPDDPALRSLESITKRVGPAIASLLETPLARRPEALVRAAVRSNVRAAVGHLRTGSPVIERLVGAEGLLVVGAELDLGTGVVDFFEGLPVATPRRRPAPARARTARPAGPRGGRRRPARAR